MLGWVNRMTEQTMAPEITQTYDWKELVESPLYQEIMELLTRLATEARRPDFARVRVEPLYQPEPYQDGFVYTFAGFEVKATPFRKPEDKYEQFEREDQLRIMEASNSQFQAEDGDMLGNIHFHPFGIMYRPETRVGDQVQAKTNETTAIMLASLVAFVDFFSRQGREFSAVKYFYGDSNRLMADFAERFGFILEPVADDPDRVELFAPVAEVEKKVFEYGKRTGLLKRGLSQAQGASFAPTSNY